LLIDISGGYQKLDSSDSSSASTSCWPRKWLHENPEKRKSENFGLDKVDHQSNYMAKHERFVLAPWWISWPYKFLNI
jgi:hypothetical protein